MTDEKHIVKAEVDTLPVQVQTRTHPLVSAALQNPGMLDTQTMRELMQMQREYEINEAKKAFDCAKIELMREMPKVIAKNKEGHNSRYASLSKILDECHEFISKHNFELNWHTENDPKMITVTCRLTHAFGHYEESTLTAPADTSGNKNAIQAIGSTVKYLKRYTASCVLGIDEEDMPDAGDKSEEDKQRVDTTRNLKALARLGNHGITKMMAEEYVAKSVQYWTEQDLETLHQYMTSFKYREREPGEDG